MRRIVVPVLLASVVIVLILGLFQLAAGPVPMASEPGARTGVNGKPPTHQPKVGWNGKEAGYLLEGGAEPNVGWNGKLSAYLLEGPDVQPNVGWNSKPAAGIAAPDEVVCYDFIRIRPMVGWNG